VAAGTIPHVFAEAAGWRHAVLSDAERAALAPVRPPGAAPAVMPDDHAVKRPEKLPGGRSGQVSRVVASAR
jgi:hypothetical protein